MEDYKNLDKNELVDLFSGYMQRYTTLKRELGSEEDLMRCRMAIDVLMREIEARNGSSAFGNSSDPSSDESRVA